MINPLKNLNARPKPSANVVDGKLILSFPHAQTPVVWQMDLTQAKSSALEVVKAEKGKSFSLELKTQKGEKVAIAKFDNREDAINGLMAASKALENAHGSIQIAANEDQKIAITSAPRKKSTKGQWITGIFVIFALILLFGMWGANAPRAPQSLATAAGGPGAQQGASAAQSAGVPVSADDFLNGL